ncbi:MAG: head-tail connector protein [Holosporales bacterium]|nr:head-tail connector protein [Holosporales bacterium]
MLNVIESSPILAVSLQKAKKYLRVEHLEDDDQIKLLIGAATKLIEQDIGQSLLTKVWKKRSTADPVKGGYSRINLQYPPLAKVLSLNEVWGDRDIDVRPIRRYIVEWERTIPSVLFLSTAEKFEVVYQAGFGEKSSDIPDPIRQAILMVVADMYEKQESCWGMNPKVNVLLNPYRLRSIV